MIAIFMKFDHTFDKLGHVVCTVHITLIFIVTIVNKFDNFKTFYNISAPESKQTELVLVEFEQIL